MNVFKSLLILILIVMMLTMVSCDCDNPKNPVSEQPTDLKGCGSFSVDQSGVVGEMIGIYYSDQYSKVTVLWGDNSPVESYNVNNTSPIAYHIYNNAGHYNINVTVYSPRGYTCKCSRWVTIGDKDDPNPGQISFSITATPSYGKPPLNVAFTHSFTATDGATCQSIAWDFGDNSTGQGLTASHTYTSTGDFDVVATATDSLQRTAKAYATVLVSDKENPNPDPGNQPPTVSITSDKNTVDVKGDINLTANASDPDGTIENYEWVLGDGSSEAGKTKSDVTHQYFNTAGATYNVYCIVTDNKGATGQSNTIQITVKPNQRPVVYSKINGYGEGTTPEVNLEDNVEIDMCSSKDLNSGDSVVSYKYSSPGLDPSSGEGANCKWNATAKQSGEISIILHVEDSYGLWSNAQNRRVNVKEQQKCEFTGATTSKIVVAYHITSGGCSPYPSTSTYNSPGNGDTMGFGCPVVSGTKNFMTSGSGTYDITWSVKANGTNCTASDRFTVTTELLNICGGGDWNNDAGPIQVIPNNTYTYSITVTGTCTSLNRIWRYYVNGNKSWEQILDSVNPH